VWILALLACRHDSPSEDGDPVVVYVTPDTLGATQAEDLGWCGQMQDLLGDYGLDAGCIGGGVPPASWTAESHTRMLWPTHRAGELRANKHPECGENSVLSSLAAKTGAHFVWAADNAVLGRDGDAGQDCGDQPSWAVDADALYTFSGDLSNSYGMANDQEEPRPVELGVADLVDHARRGALVGFLNVFEAGGHLPRCWMDPYTEACEALWGVMVEGGYVTGDEDRAAAWRDQTVGNQLLKVAAEQAGREDEMRAWTLAATEESIANQQARRLETPLRALLSGLQDEDRLGDLVLVMVADHGENPCVGRWPEDTLHCEHGGLLTEWTGNVPALVSPASLAEDWAERGFVGSDGDPWSTTNLAYAIADAFDLAEAEEWPEMEPVGTATSWTCKGNARDTDGYLGGGVVVEGDASFRCTEETCAAFEWRVPTSATDYMALLDPVPDALSGVDPRWAIEACGN
jgi:hypothetical protein